MLLHKTGQEASIYKIIPQAVPFKNLVKCLQDVGNHRSTFIADMAADKLGGELLFPLAANIPQFLVVLIGIKVQCIEGISLLFQIVLCLLANAWVQFQQSGLPFWGKLGHLGLIHKIIEHSD